MSLTSDLKSRRTPVGRWARDRGPNAKTGGPGIVAAEQGAPTSTAKSSAVPNAPVGSPVRPFAASGAKCWLGRPGVRRSIGDDTLRTIALELVAKLREDATIDRTIMETVRARVRSGIERLLLRHRYPPDKAESAIDLVPAKRRSSPRRGPPNPDVASGLTWLGPVT